MINENPIITLGFTYVFSNTINGKGISIGINNKNNIISTLLDAFSCFFSNLYIPYKNAKIVKQKPIR